VSVAPPIEPDDGHEKSVSAEFYTNLHESQRSFLDV
jgi:hypothetical protein